MTEEERKQWLKQMTELDDAAEKAGGYVSFTNKVEESHYDYRAIIRYCEENGTVPSNMKEEELNKFIIKQPCT